MISGADDDLALIKVSFFGITSRQGEWALLDAGIVSSRSAIPRDPNAASALTPRGFGTAGFGRVAS